MLTTKTLTMPRPARCPRIYAAYLAAFIGLAVPAAIGDSITWYKIGGGGAMFTSDGAEYLLSGTIAQCDAGTLSGGSGATAFSLTGGFWAGSPRPPCAGDADADGDVDQDDIDIVLFNYPSSVPPGTNGDLDGDGDVDQDDIDMVLFNYGTPCP